VRRLAWVGLALTVVALGLGVTERMVDSQEAPGVTESNLRRVREGMSLVEVEGIFGRAADYYTGPLLERYADRGAEIAAWWEEGDGCVRVWLDDKRRVLDTDSRGLRGEDGALACLRSLLGW
jgi:hypothetical protein